MSSLLHVVHRGVLSVPCRHSPAGSAAVAGLSPVVIDLADPDDTTCAVHAATARPWASAARARRPIRLAPVRLRLSVDLRPSLRQSNGTGQDRVRRHGGSLGACL